MELQTFDQLIISMAEGDTSPGTTSPALYGAAVKLFGQNLTITPNTTLAELDAASMTFGGYAPHPITWGPVTIAEDGAYEVLGSVSPFAPTGDDSTQLAWGMYVTDHADRLLLAGQFDAPPLNMASPMNVIQITMRHRPEASEPVVVIS